MSPRFTFSKTERLCSKKQIDLLFAKGISIKQYPFTFIIAHSEEASAWPQVLISVSKRKFKRANKRNRIKRQIRELYRLSKHQFFSGQEQLLLGVIYQSNELLEFDFLQKKLNLGLQRCKDESAKLTSGSTFDPEKKKAD